MDLVKLFGLHIYSPAHKEIVTRVKNRNIYAGSKMANDIGYIFDLDLVNDLYKLGHLQDTPTVLPNGELGPAKVITSKYKRYLAGYYFWRSFALIIVVLAASGSLLGHSLARLLFG